VDTERNAIGHTHVRLKRTCVGSNGILECEFLSKNAHRTIDGFITAIDFNTMFMIGAKSMKGLRPYLRWRSNVKVMSARD
jgi:hypothetical protein